MAKPTDGWREHRQAQLARWRRATPAQRLAWLEEAIDFAHRAGALQPASTRRERGRPGSGW